jgi:hypothetical protein
METAWIISRETWAWGVHWGLVAWICIFCLMHQKDVKDTGETGKTQNRNGKNKQKWQEQTARTDGKNRRPEKTARPMQSSRAKVSPSSERCIPGPTGYLAAFPAKINLRGRKRKIEDSLQRDEGSDTNQRNTAPDPRPTPLGDGDGHGRETNNAVRLAAAAPLVSSWLFPRIIAKELIAFPIRHRNLAVTPSQAKGATSSSLRP